MELAGTTCESHSPTADEARNSSPRPGEGGCRSEQVNAIGRHSRSKHIHQQSGFAPLPHRWPVEERLSMSEPVSIPNSPAIEEPADRLFPPRWQRTLLNLATCLILMTIGWCNLPDEVPRSVIAGLEQNCSPQMAHRIRWGEWVWKWGAHLAGFDNKWQMYGLQSRFNWHYQIIATYGEGDQQVDRLLPLPRQSERTYWQRAIVDFKEAKFHLNIYNDPLARETYAHYLAHQFPEFNGQRLKRIRYAVKQQQLLEDWVQTDTVSNFDLSAVVSKVLGPEPKPLLPADWNQAVSVRN
jgi:hypothetical protein